MPDPNRPVEMPLAISSMKALMTKLNRPKVTRVTGSERTLMTGLIQALTKASANAHMAGPRYDPPTAWMPGTMTIAAIVAMVETSHVPRNDMMNPFLCDVAFSSSAGFYPFFCDVAQNRANLWMV